MADINTILPYINEVKLVKATSPERPGEDLGHFVQVAFDAEFKRNVLDKAADGIKRLYDESVLNWLKDEGGLDVAHSTLPEGTRIGSRFFMTYALQTPKDQEVGNKRKEGDSALEEVISDARSKIASLNGRLPPKELRVG